MNPINKNHQAAVSDDNTLKRFPVRKSELDRFKFGKRIYFQIASSTFGHTPLCLDVACGAKPFPKADVVCDLNILPVKDRSMKRLETTGKPFVLCSCYFLPFKDGAFDFATSYYLLEHINYPGMFYSELKRVAKHGFIQCPTWFNEFLYGEEVHNWIVIKQNNRLFVKPINNKSKQTLALSFIFHRLYRFHTWQLLHAIIDEITHVFTVTISF
ncbi:MAG: class I SAM-dependent methyltransferase [Candidatus Bathyarchaeota archaeon]|nr:class I SAM-dependent methyltransferase [Candidatus Termiticorpusculum sp.]